MFRHSRNPSPCAFLSAVLRWRGSADSKSGALSSAEGGWPAVLWLPAAALAIAAYLLLTNAAFDFTIDDAFISMRYADNLARHGELVWNPGETVKVEGYSNLLWVLMLAAAYRFLPWDPLLMTKLTSLFFGATTLLMFAVLAARLVRRSLLVIAATVLLAASRPFVVWACSGMENMLYMFLISLALYLLVMEDQRGRLSYLTPVILFLICLTRTEGVVFFALAFIVRLVRLPGMPRGASFLSRRSQVCRAEAEDPVLPERTERAAVQLRGSVTREWVVYHAVFALLFAGWTVWRWWYYGSVVPLPVYLKTAQGGSGILYIRDFMVYYAPYVPLMALGVVTVDYRKPEIYPAGFLAVYLAALAAANPVMGMEFRLILAALPLMLLLAVMALRRMLDHLASWRSVAAAAGIGLFLLHWEVGFPHLYRGRLQGLAANYHHFLEDLYIPLGRWLHGERLERGEMGVALYDAGATPFYAADCRVIDILGLNDPEFARKPMEPETLLARNPDYVVLKSSSPDVFVNNPDIGYGAMSDMIYHDARFRGLYELDRVWSDRKKLYVVWVYRRRT